MSPTVIVFNQYYIDLLKKVKDVARDLKHKADDQDARAVLREIKRTYSSFDRSSSEHIEWFKKQMGPLQELLAKEADIVSLKDWYTASGIAALEVYQGITIEILNRVIRSKDVLLYYFVLFATFAHEDMNDEITVKVVDILKAPQISDEMFTQIPESIQHLITLLKSMHHTTTNKSLPSDAMMNDIESTSLGKLAKEIMSEINVEEIQKNVGEDGDILKALSNPDSGLTSLLGTVSQKMISKIASGELRQETLLQDAMKLATSLPGMMPKAGAGVGGGLGDMGSMFDQIGKMASMFGGGGGSGEDGGFDIASMMQQFMPKQAGSGSGGGAGARTQVNTSGINRAMKAKQLRRKLEERRKAKENIE